VFTSSVFFFQAEDGIRDWSVTGVQTCALPICSSSEHLLHDQPRLLGPPGAGEALDEPERADAEGPLARAALPVVGAGHRVVAVKIGRASCRERVENAGGGG